MNFQDLNDPFTLFLQQVSAVKTLYSLLKSSKCVISSQESFFSFPQCQAAAAANFRHPSISCLLQQKSFYFEEDNTGMSTSLSTFLNVTNLSYCCSSAKMKEALGPEKNWKLFVQQCVSSKHSKKLVDTVNLKSQIPTHSSLENFSALMKSSRIFVFSLMKCIIMKCYRKCLNQEKFFSKNPTHSKLFNKVLLFLVKLCVAIASIGKLQNLIKCKRCISVKWLLYHLTLCFTSM